MHIHVVGDDSIGDQARIYAEYRLFAELSRALDSRRVSSASLALSRARRGRNAGAVVCAVTIHLRNGEVARVRGSGEHPYAAINRAVERLRQKTLPVPLDPREPKPVAVE